MEAGERFKLYPVSNEVNHSKEGKAFRKKATLETASTGGGSGFFKILKYLGLIILIGAGINFISRLFGGADVV